MVEPEDMVLELEGMVVIRFFVSPFGLRIGWGLDSLELGLGLTFTVKNYRYMYFISTWPL